jgi:hypothetical protein
VVAVIGILLALGFLFTAMYFVLAEGRQYIHTWKRSRAHASIEDDVRREHGIPPGEPLTTKARSAVERRRRKYDKDNPPPRGAFEDFTESLSKALPWAFGLGALGVGAKVYFDYRSGKQGGATINITGPASPTTSS